MSLDPSSTAVSPESLHPSVPGGSKCDAGRYALFGVDDAKRLFGDRKLYLWGAGQKGRGFHQALQRCGFRVEAFIDSNAQALPESFKNTNIISPQAFFSLPEISRNAFVLTASVDKKNKVMFEALRSHGFEKGVSFESIQLLSPFYPTVEIAGVCNLRCSGCIRSDKSMIDAGKMMSLENYEKVIKKLVREIPFLYLVDLYIYGEPILNRDLPGIIRLNNSLGIASGLSTNLNDIRHLSAVLDEEPALIRVSISGASAETYEVTHTGGDWTKVAANLETLAAQVKARGNKTIVELYLHVYQHNTHEIGIVRELCSRYGFRFHPALGLVLSGDFVLEYARSGRVPPSAAEADRRTLLPMDRLVEDCRAQSHLNCLLTRVVPVINWDLSVMPCCNYGYTSIAPNYLEVDLKDIIRTRTSCSLCLECQSHALHRWNNQGYYLELVEQVIHDNEK